jgi:hypothetical protein
VSAADQDGGCGVVGEKERARVLSVLETSRGLKPVSIVDAYAALKRRSSTFVHAFMPFREKSWSK